MCADKFVVSKENSSHYTWGNNCDGWHLAATQNLSVIHERVPAGCSEKRHLHEKAEQFFFILAGVATFEMNETVHTLKAQEGILVPPLQPHCLSNNKAEDLEFIVVSTPPSHKDRMNVERFAEPTIKSKF